MACGYSTSASISVVGSRWAAAQLTSNTFVRAASYRLVPSPASLRRCSTIWTQSVVVLSRLILQLTIAHHGYDLRPIGPCGYRLGSRRSTEVMAGWGWVGMLGWVPEAWEAQPIACARGPF